MIDGPNWRTDPVDKGSIAVRVFCIDALHWEVYEIGSEFRQRTAVRLIEFYL